MASNFFDVYEELETLIDEGPGEDNAAFAAKINAVSTKLASEAATLTPKEVDAEYDEDERDDFNDEDEIEV